MLSAGTETGEARPPATAGGSGLDAGLLENGRLPEKPWLLRGLGLAALGSFVAAFLAALFCAPTEQTMGHAQRIFYSHVPSAWIAFVAFFVVCAASILLLWKRKGKWDILALSSAELGVLFARLVLVRAHCGPRRLGASGGFGMLD